MKFSRRRGIRPSNVRFVQHPGSHKDRNPTESSVREPKKRPSIRRALYGETRNVEDLMPSLVTVRVLFLGDL